MKRVTGLLCGFASLSIGSQGHAQVFPDKTVAVSEPSEIGLTVDDMNRSTNGRPTVRLPDGSLVCQLCNNVS